MLTVAEAAKKLTVCHTVVRAWVAAGRLPHYRVGATGRGKILIREADLDAFFESLRVGVPAASKSQPPPPKLKHLKV